jgi:tRNA-dihydrouridine synthase
MENWLNPLLEENPALITIHARTRKEMSKVPARWERLSEAVKLRDEINPDVLIAGNGDVLSLDDAHNKARTTGVEGVMIGRALFGNPWFFHPTKRLPVHLKALPTKGVNRDTLYEESPVDDSLEYISLKERLAVMVKHSQLFEELLPFKNFAVMKKHYKAYVNSFPGASELRARLMESNSSAEVEDIVERFLAHQY